MSKPDSIIFKLILGYSEGRLSQSEFNELKYWLEQDSENKRFFSEYLVFLKQVKRVGFADKAYHDDAWENISNKLAKRKMRILPTFLRYAAAIAIPVLLAVSAYLWFERPVENVEVAQVVEPGKPCATLILGNGEQIDLENWSDSIIALAEGTHLQKRAEMLNYQDADIQHEVFNTLRIPRGGEYFIILSDGTKIWLNSDTELRYPVKFLSDTREIYLKGEIYLEVAQNKEKPFIVHANNSSIEVLGTQFNVKAYEDEVQIETTLIEGSVQLFNKSLASVVLKPGEQGIIAKDVAQILVHEVETSVYTAWKDGMFRFRSFTLSEIMKRFERWYDIDVFYEDENLKELHFTGNMKRYQNINPHLEVIELTTHVNFELNGDELIVRNE